RKLHQTLRKITDDFNLRWHFNTSIAAIMELLNELYATVEGEVWSNETLIGTIKQLDGTPLPFRHEELLQGSIRWLLIMLFPFAPFAASELWERVGEKTTLLREPWPTFNPLVAKPNEIEIPIQMNGKLRSRILVPADAPEELVRERALADEKIRIWLD